MATTALENPIVLILYPGPMINDAAAVAITNILLWE